MSVGLVCHHTDFSTLYCSSIAAFVTLCEAYMGIEPHFNLWNYFFHVRLLQGSGMEVVVLGGVDLYVRARHACALSKMTHMLAIV
jgi:hypothetical protein